MKRKRDEERRAAIAGLTGGGSRGGGYEQPRSTGGSFGDFLQSAAGAYGAYRGAQQQQDFSRVPLEAQGRLNYGGGFERPVGAPTTSDELIRFWEGRVR